MTGMRYRSANIWGNSRLWDSYV